MIPGGLNRLLKKQGKQNKRDMQDIPGQLPEEGQKLCQDLRQGKAACKAVVAKEQAGFQNAPGPGE
jgi:hypothetical protein